MRTPGKSFPAVVFTSRIMSCTLHRAGILALAEMDDALNDVGVFVFSR